MAQAMAFNSLTVELRAQDVEDKDGPFPESTANFNVTSELGIFRVLDLEGVPLSQPSAVRLVATYTADDVAQAAERKERLLLGIYFEETTLLWSSQPPIYPTVSPFPGYWEGSGWFTFEIPDPDPEGGQFSLDISGNLSDPAVGVGSG